MTWRSGNVLRPTARAEEASPGPAQKLAGSERLGSGRPEVADAACSPERLFCHVQGRSKAAAQIIPGWPYSFVAALTPDRTSWTAVLDAVRLGPEEDEMAVIAHQFRQVVERLVRAASGSPETRTCWW